MKNVLFNTFVSQWGALACHDDTNQLFLSVGIHDSAMNRAHLGRRTKAYGNCQK